MNHYHIKDYGFHDFFNEIFNKVIFYILLISTFFLLVLWNSEFMLGSYLNLFMSISIFSTISDLVIHLVMGLMWGNQSMCDLKIVTDKESEDNSKVDLNKLHQASWLPRIVGILERIIMATGFAIGHYELVVGWLVLKVVKIKDSNGEKQQQNSLWRVIENIFLIGTALSLISSFAGAEVYKYIHSHSTSLKVIENKKRNIYFVPTKNRYIINTKLNY